MGSDAGGGGVSGGKIWPSVRAHALGEAKEREGESLPSLSFLASTASLLLASGGLGVLVGHLEASVLGLLVGDLIAPLLGG